MTGGASVAQLAATVLADGDRIAGPVSEALIRPVPLDRQLPPSPASSLPPAPPAPSDVPESPEAEPALEDAAPAGEPARRAGRRRRGTGIREKRRQETRARIVEAAADLFAVRGFDAVSVMEIAARAGVVEKTVFNHFPVKEGLVFEADPPMRGALLDAVRSRPRGASASAAAGNFIVAAMSMLGAPEAAHGLAEMARVVRGSRTLQVREREILRDMTTALAELIAEETGAEPGDPEPWLTAHAVLGLYAALLEVARDRAVAGTP
ncbi:MAG: TetR/AcrR family transcriptional regulator, partial [Kineosporiaceae bacterium]